MTNDLERRAHDLDVTVWVGKAGLDPVVEELRDQLADRELVKVKFLRSARGGTTTEELEVFTRREQYDVIIEVDDRDVQFDTRPICPDSLTEVIVPERAGLGYDHLGQRVRADRPGVELDIPVVHLDDDIVLFPSREHL